MNIIRLPIATALFLGTLLATSAAHAATFTNNPGTASLAFIEDQSSVTNTNTVSVTITVILSGTDFTNPVGSGLLLDTHITGSISGPSGAHNLLSVTGCANPNNTLFSCSVAADTVQQSPDITGSAFTSDAAAILVSSLTAPFSMTEMLTMTLGAGETLTFDATASLVPTPLPAALPLFATGLGGLGLLGWRRKRKAQGVA